MDRRDVDTVPALIAATIVFAFGLAALLVADQLLHVMGAIFVGAFLGGAIAAGRCDGRHGETITGIAGPMAGYLLVIPFLAAVRLVELEIVADASPDDTIFLLGLLSLMFSAIFGLAVLFFAMVGATIGGAIGRSTPSQGPRRRIGR